MLKIGQISLLVFTLGTSTFSYAQETRQHGAHEHGTGEINIAVEDNSLTIDLSLPAMNVVGFEHPANTDLEKETLKKAAGTLKKASLLFKPSAAAQCTLAHSNVESALLATDEAHSEHHEQPEEHADFDASYEFQCANPTALTQIEVLLFQEFSGTTRIKTQWISQNGQGGVELSPHSTTLILR